MSHYPTSHLPELLAPAGSPEALEAAFLAGADAVYLGGSRFNARLNAHNFDTPRLREAVAHAHRMGGRVYLTLNTLVWDRELPLALEAAYEAASAGVDALIVADVGVAALIHRALPQLPLHASTQLSGHNAAVGEVLAPFGFTRFVIARETPFGDLATAVTQSPLEVEVFIHGALCVSHSGQCLFSSVVGGRSGNRGECAQPCRLPYACAEGRTAPKAPKGGNRRATPAETEKYPLSLKDLSLAAHVPTLIRAGVSSLKIEGRMKSPGYVGGVTAIWRKLLDEGRAATPDELNALQDLFSRDGFTDGYQTGKITHAMMGIRTAEDKERTAAAEKAALTAKYPPRLPLTMTFTAAEGHPVTLTASAPLYRQGSTESASVTVEGEAPTAAETQPLTAEAAEKQLSRTGGTPYRAVAVASNVEEGLMVPLSRLNALRREALEKLDEARGQAMPPHTAGYTPVSPNTVTAEILQNTSSDSEQRTCTTSTARFHTPEQITPQAADYFQQLYLPLGKVHPAFVPVEKRGVLLPPVIFDSETPHGVTALTTALREGVRHLLVGNIGHLPMVWETARLCKISPESLFVHGDFRLNVANTPAAARYLALGVRDLLLSPELTLPRMRDLSAALTAQGHPATTGAVVYGRLPLMLLEKCALREVYGQSKPDAVCREICSRNRGAMRDRVGKEFPILREDFPTGRGHRNLVYNSLPTGMSDRSEELSRAGLSNHHFIFSVESPAEVDRVITAYQENRPLACEVRRMLK